MLVVVEGVGHEHEGGAFNRDKDLTEFISKGLLKEDIFFVFGEVGVDGIKADLVEEEERIGNGVENRKRKSIQTELDGHIIRFGFIPIELRRTESGLVHHKRLFPVASIVVSFFEGSDLKARVSVELLGEVVSVDTFLFAEAIEIDLVKNASFKDRDNETGASSDSGRAHFKIFAYERNFSEGVGVEVFADRVFNRDVDSVALDEAELDSFFFGHTGVEHAVGKATFHFEHFEFAIFDEVDKGIETTGVFVVDSLVGDLCVSDKFETFYNGSASLVVLFFVFNWLLNTSVNKVSET